jgi:prepilin-type N-terminal cleavage/methylation domain-containing protein
MGLPSTTLKRKGFSLIEVLVVLAVSGIMFVLIAALFQAGTWEVRRSSGRIEVVRRGRQAIENCQMYLSSACQPGERLDPTGAQTQAIFGPDALDDLNHPNPASFVRFFTAVDHLVDPTPLKARELQTNPDYHAYELAAVPGLNGKGQDLVLRKFLVPNAPQLPHEHDILAKPRILARRLGIPKAGGYEDGFVVRHLREGAVQIQVNVSSDLISDATQRSRIEQATPMRIKMSSIYQLPFYNVQ